METDSKPQMSEIFKEIRENLKRIGFYKKELRKFIAAIKEGIQGMKDKGLPTWMQEEDRWALNCCCCSCCPRHHPWKQNLRMMHRKRNNADVPNVVSWCGAIVCRGQELRDGISVECRSKREAPHKTFWPGHREG